MISDNQVHIPPRVGESRFTLANTEKMYKTFGWKPYVTLEEWISKNA